VDIVLPRGRDVEISISAPPSKSYTHRALIAAALAAGESDIAGPLRSGDTEMTCRALSRLGVPIGSTADGWHVEGGCGSLPGPCAATVDVEGSGTTARFLAAAGLRAPRPFVLTGNQRMRERPVGPLVDALNAVGGRIRYCERPGSLPLCVEGSFRGGDLRMSGEVSSQFISAVLLPAPCTGGGLDLTLDGLPVSSSYIDCTLDVMEQFGAVCRHTGHRHFSVHPGGYRGRHYRVEGDYSSAAYFFAVAAVCGGRCTVRNLRPDSPQGDRVVLTALERMGCTVTPLADGWRVESTGELTGVRQDMRAAPDAVQTLAMVAAFARSPTTLTGTGHLRYKESDRVHQIVEVLGRLGVRVDSEDDQVTIHPAPLRPAVIDPADDHRVAMSAAVAGLGIGGVTVRHAECVSKSYPAFWEVCREAGLL